MAPLPNAPGHVRVAVNGTFGGRGVANILHFAAGGSAYTTADLNALCTAIRAAWVTRFIPNITTNYTLTNVFAQDLTSPTAFSGNASGSTAGTSAGNTNAANVACCITWKIGRRYRGGHPRTYLCPPGGLVSTSDPTSWAGSYLTAVQTAATGFITDTGSFTPPAGGIPWQFECLHYRIGGSPQVPPIGDNITAAVVDSRVDSQRRRLGRDR